MVWGQFLNSSPRGLGQETQDRGRGFSVRGTQGTLKWTVLDCTQGLPWTGCVPRALAVVWITISTLRWQPCLPTPKSGVSYWDVSPIKGGDIILS